MSIQFCITKRQIIFAIVASFQLRDCSSTHVVLPTQMIIPQTGKISCNTDSATGCLTFQFNVILTPSLAITFRCRFG